MHLRSLKFCDLKLCQIMNEKWILRNDLIHLFERVRQCQYDAACPRDFSPGGDELVLLVVLMEILHMVGHVGIQFIKRNDVGEVDDVHGCSFECKLYKTSNS